MCGVDFDVSADEDQRRLFGDANAGSDHHTSCVTADHGICYCGLLLTLLEKLTSILEIAEYFDR
ncbi:hypothetical protein KIN20_030248 [Parelaphostrongylus tenuis]|uniref:Uncharacterized protein n=1 Tax=Parelaphostrongylus tenuis TaxID=148309 RepID=A0AAD5R4I2_PARTN|nr:hypothetical protein KIN20_030248 [Parelaphostrongylus tenuis]